MRSLGILSVVLTTTCINSPAQNDSTSSDSSTSTSSSGPEDEDESGNETEDSGDLGEPGEILWIHANQEQSDESVDYWGTVTLDSSGNDYVGGVASTPSLHPLSLMVRQYTPDGQREWTYEAPADKFASARMALSEITPTREGGLVIAGEPEGSALGGERFQAWAGMLDNQGSLQWQVYPVMPEGQELDTNCWITDVLELDEGGLVMLHRKVVSTTDKVWLHRYDSDGNWQKTVPVAFSHEVGSISKMIQLPEGRFALGGTVHKSEPPNYRGAWVAILDASFQLEWESLIDPDDNGTNGIMGLSIAGDILWASGQHYDEDRNTHVWVGQISHVTHQLLWSDTWEATIEGGTDLGWDIAAIDENRAVVASNLMVREDGQVKAHVSEVRANAGAQWTTELSLPEHPSSDPRAIVYDPKGAAVVVGIAGGINLGGFPLSPQGWIAKVAI